MLAQTMKKWDKESPELTDGMVFDSLDGAPQFKTKLLI